MPTKGFAGFLFPVAKVVGHFALDVRPLADQVLLGLEHSASDQCVCAAFHLDALLKADVREWNIELRDQKLSEIRLDLVMAGLAMQVSEDLNGFRPSGHA